MTAPLSDIPYLPSVDDRRPDAALTDPSQPLVRSRLMCGQSPDFEASDKPDTTLALQNLLRHFPQPDAVLAGIRDGAPSGFITPALAADILSARATVAHLDALEAGR